MDNFQYIVYVYSMIQDTSYSTLMNNDWNMYKKWDMLKGYKIINDTVRMTDILTKCYLPTKRLTKDNSNIVQYYTYF